MFDPFAHNPDTNPNWTPLFALRVYRCEGCGTETTLYTNHTGTTYGTRCAGRCRNIIHAHTSREQVLPAHTHHHYLREA